MAQLCGFDRLEQVMLAGILFAIAETASEIFTACECLPFFQLPLGIAVLLPARCESVTAYLAQGITLHSKSSAPSKILVHDQAMRTSVSLDDDAYQIASAYASARETTLSAAICELIRKASAPPEPSLNTIGPYGLRMFAPAAGSSLMKW